MGKGNIILRHFFSRIFIYNTVYCLYAFKGRESRILCGISSFGRYTLVEVSNDFSEFVCRYAEEKLIDSSSSKSETDDINSSYSDIVMNEDNWIHLDEETIKKFTYNKIFDIVMKEQK